MQLQFTTLDVFTSTRLQGNPLAVVQVPGSLRCHLTQPIKQKIAQEFNLSETVFLHDVKAASAEAREIDIFTVEREVPFAGHPTVGTAVLVRHHMGGTEKVQSLVTKAGPIGIETSAPSKEIRAKIPHNIHLHERTLRNVLSSTETAGLHPNPAIREAELGAPIFSVVNGMTFILVALPSLDLLTQVKVLRLDFEALSASLLDDGWTDSLVCRYYYVDVDGDEQGGENSGKIRYLRTRMVELGFEDPATGSAATALASYLTLNEEKSGGNFHITQGVEIGRKSVISVETTTKGARVGDGYQLDELWLGGTAVVTMQGTLEVDV
ncbi:hypothetical protein F5Y18DRAFT_410250 [Xylariaceae sp. FL1019]|nr:hypothetical protein F5Y18DRAFT_410250 [Xylariaceae sp. FL1019]